MNAKHYNSYLPPYSPSHSTYTLHLLHLLHYPSYTYYTYLPFTLSPRSLMPGKAQHNDLDDRSLDHSFRADKIEFVVVSRIREG